MPRQPVSAIEADGRDSDLRDGSFTGGGEPDFDSDGFGSNPVPDRTTVAGGDLEAPLPKKRRGRPRKEVSELASELPDPSLAAPKERGRGRRKGPDLSALVETTVVGLFGLVAVATAHEHWLKERADVMAITGPLNAWIDQLPAKTIKKLETNLAPALFVVGLATVVGPDVVMELRIRNEQNARRTVSGPERGFLKHFNTPTEDASRVSNGAGRQPSNEGGWHSGIPAVPPIGSEFDV